MLLYGAEGFAFKMNNEILSCTVEFLKNQIVLVALYVVTDTLFFLSNHSKSFFFLFTAFMFSPYTEHPLTGIYLM